MAVMSEADSRATEVVNRVCGELQSVFPSWAVSDGYLINLGPSCVARLPCVRYLPHFSGRGRAHLVQTEVVVYKMDLPSLTARPFSLS
jgi:hypothetical protein